MKVGDAAAGAALGEIFNGSCKVITHVTKRTIQFQSYLESLKSTLSRLEVLVEDIRQSHEELARSPGGEIKGLVELVKKGEKLVNECSKLKWWKQSIRFAYADKLRNLDKELLVFFQRDIMARIMRDLSETMKLVIEIRERVNPTENIFW
ncbi:uncharacterized protein LOC121249085 [Juglans microcarpa x Juglans regia]|uniref:uncharacterized protein LOC121249085 n=1 Tax=Juglans microcarpa x Juglans regia TaxID=2249226 RepID=UPI001B7ECF42|nr:uncharacterized protein LOC121249085 [Juglans microcarpa x Juglans regia]